MFVCVLAYAGRGGEFGGGRLIGGATYGRVYTVTQFDSYMDVMI